MISFIFRINRFVFEVLSKIFQLIPTKLLPRPFWIVLLVPVSYYLFRRLCKPKTATACVCRCILIAPYNSNGVRIESITGCLYCDRSRRLQTAAKEALASLRSKRNSHGSWAFTGAAVSFLGNVATGSLFEILSGSSISTAIKTGRFFSVNNAVNRLKPFLADVLTNRPHIANCKCNPSASSQAVSGFCDLSGGKYDYLINNAPDSRTVNIDTEKLSEYFQSQLDTGGTFMDAISRIFDYFA